MEKKVYELNIDPELRDYIPPLSQVEFDLLRESIVEEGCNEPLSVWNDTIVDGHNRYRICHENNIPFEYKEMSFDSKQDAMFWMAKRQLGRRNLKPFQRCELVYPLEKQIREEVEKRRRAAISNTKKGVNTGLNVGQFKRTGEYMAEYADVSRATWNMAKVLIEKVAEEVKDGLRRDDIAISTEYKKLRAKAEPERKSCKREEQHSSSTEPSSPTKKEADPETYAPHKPESYSANETEDDDPSDFEDIKEQLDYAFSNFMGDLEYALDWLSGETATPENETRIIEMIDELMDKAKKAVIKKMEEEKNE